MELIVAEGLSDAKVNSSRQTPQPGSPRPASQGKGPRQANVKRDALLVTRAGVLASWRSLWVRWEDSFVTRQAEPELHLAGLEPVLLGAFSEASRPHAVGPGDAQSCQVLEPWPGTPPSPRGLGSWATSVRRS